METDSKSAKRKIDTGWPQERIKHVKSEENMRESSNTLKDAEESASSNGAKKPASSQDALVRNAAHMVTFNDWGVRSGDLEEAVPGKIKPQSSKLAVAIKQLTLSTFSNAESDNSIEFCETSGICVKISGNHNQPSTSASASLGESRCSRTVCCVFYHQFRTLQENRTKYPSCWAPMICTRVS